MILTIIHRAVDRAAGDEAEKLINKVNSEIITNGFPFYGISPVVIGLLFVVIICVIIAYSFAGKGRGSHAGREEVRRSYRRELARQMARQDAEKIKKGEKPRRKWMQW